MPDEELRTKLTPVLVERRCSNQACLGRMVFTGSGVTPGMSASLWDHACAECGTRQQFTTVYPYTEFRDEARKVRCKS